MSLQKTIFVYSMILFAFPVVSFAAQGGPSIQERRAMQEIQAMNMKKQQEVAIFKRQRDELLMNYKAVAQMKNKAQGQMKLAQRDYKSAMARFNQAKLQEEQIEAEVYQLRKKSSKIDDGVVDQEMKRLRESQSELIEMMKNLSKVQQESYQNMLSFDDQYRNLTAKEQVLRQQIEMVQRQLQFVVSQP